VVVLRFQGDIPGVKVQESDAGLFGDVFRVQSHILGKVEFRQHLSAELVAIAVGVLKGRIDPVQPGIVGVTSRVGDGDGSQWEMGHD
jgi:hypothetical protein